MTGLDERSAFDGRPTSDLMPTKCWSASWPGPLRPSEWGIEAKHETGEFALDLSVVDLAKVCAAREAIETQPPQLCPPPREPRSIGPSGNWLTASGKADTGGGGGLATT